MAKKKDKERKKQSRAESVRAAAAQAVQSAAGQAQLTRDRAQELADELTSAAVRVRSTLDDLRPPTGDDVKGIAAAARPHRGPPRRARGSGRAAPHQPRARGRRRRAARRSAASETAAAATRAAAKAGRSAKAGSAAGKGAATKPAAAKPTAAAKPKPADSTTGSRTKS